MSAIYLSHQLQLKLNLGEIHVTRLLAAHNNHICVDFVGRSSCYKCEYCEQCPYNKNFQIIDAPGDRSSFVLTIATLRGKFKIDLI